MPKGSEPIEADEVLYRRIPANTGWYDPNRSASVSPKAFGPNKGDTTGISLNRDKYRTPESMAAMGRRGSWYWIASLSARAVFEEGIIVNPDPAPDGSDPGHVLVPEMRFADAKESHVLEKMAALSRLCMRLDGPFLGQRDPPQKS